jgi:catechol 2,3-dioxygenase-like lactoylglutathione lyase family enzyme
MRSRASSFLENEWLAKGRSTMDWRIEVVTIPVSDIDRAKDFYAEKVGFNLDIDYRISDEVHLVQLTPTGSACSIHLGTSTNSMEPGSIDGVFLVVQDVRAARAELVERGVDTGDIQVFDEGSYRTAGEGENLDLVGCVFFSDPDGNRWCVQQIPARN